jgi:hypothetical protein
MNGKILNSPVRPQRNTLQPHHIRHLISGTLVFLLGIAANEALMHLRRHSPRRVRWTTTDMQADYVIPGGLPPTNIQVETGIAEDGTVVWRPRKE